jgi:hypothetical protein
VERLNLVTYSLRLEESLGIPPLVRCNGKQPLGQAWPSGPREHPSEWRLKLRDYVGNVGLLTGYGLVVIDVDLYVSGAQDSWDSLVDRGFTPYTVTAITGGGGRHYLYRVPVDTKVLSHSLPDFPGIDVKSHGGFIVIPPSIHVETGEEYQWEHGWGPFDVEMVELTPAQIEFLGVGSTTAHGLGRVLDERDETTVSILCEHFGGHSVRRRGETIEVTRPGKEHGSSAEIGYGGPGAARFWTPNWPPFEDRWYEAREIRKLAGIPDPEARIRIRPAEHDSLIFMQRLKSREQLWLWQDFVPAGQLVLGVGAEKLGKSTAAVWLAARATRGELDGNYEGRPINVAFISAEDDAERVLKPRAEAAGADMNKLLSLDPLGPGYDFDALADNDIEFVILDPMSIYIALSSSNEHGEINVRTALDPFAQLARSRSMTVLGVRHTRKNTNADNPFDVVLGSRAWSAAARAVLFFAPDRERPDVKGGLLFTRWNLSATDQAFRYSLMSTSVLLDDGATTEVPRFELAEGITGISLEDALGPRDKNSAGNEAEEFLLEVLPSKVKAIDDLVKSEPFSKRTLDRAKKKLGILSIWDDDHKEWWWWPPNHPQLPQDANCE